MIPKRGPQTADTEAGRPGAVVEAGRGLGVALDPGSPRRGNALERKRRHAAPIALLEATIELGPRRARRLGPRGIGRRHEGFSFAVHTHALSLAPTTGAWMRILRARAESTYSGHWPGNFGWRVKGRWLVHCP